MLYDPKWETPADIKLEPWQKILLDAADILERGNWAQHALQTREDAHCAMGAMQIAHYGKIVNRRPTEQSQEFNAAITIANQVCGQPLWMFNDTPGRTKEEVIDRLRETVKLGANIHVK